MNIFYLDHDPKIAAQYHCDKHVVKMVLESCQMLSTAHRIIDGTLEQVLTESGRRKKIYRLADHRDTFLYSATHINHPSAVWARSNVANYMWLGELVYELCKEYTYRYGKVHKCEMTGLVHYLSELPPTNLKEGEFYEPPQCMPDYCKVEGDAVQGYKNYYVNEKQRMLSWSGRVKSREVPEWALVKE